VDGDVVRLILLGNALYWIAGSLLVIGGFLVFTASTIKHLWDRAVERKAESLWHIYHFKTNVDVYNIFFEAGGRAPSSRERLPPPAESMQKELGTAVDPDRLRSLLWMLLRPEGGDPPTTVDRAGDWSPLELTAALDLCVRAQQEALSPAMQERTEGAADLLRAGLVVQG
jgi:hypothetical protein